MATGFHSKTRAHREVTQLLVAETRLTRQLPIVGLAGTAFFVVAVLALHVLQPGNDQAISTYAVGPYGALMTAAFLALGCGSWALVLSIPRILAPAARSRIGLVLLATAATGTLLSAVFRTDPPGAAQTTTGMLHEQVGLVTFVCLVIGILLFSLRFKGDPRWPAIPRVSLALALVALVLFLFTFATNAVDGLDGWFGIAQRLFIATVLAWQLVVSNHLRSVAAGPRELVEHDDHGHA
jgi:hypothetical protein